MHLPPVPVPVVSQKSTRGFLVYMMRRINAALTAYTLGPLKLHNKVTSAGVKCTFMTLTRIKSNSYLKHGVIWS